MIRDLLGSYHEDSTLVSILSVFDEIVFRSNRWEDAQGLVDWARGVSFPEDRACQSCPLVVFGAALLW
jgi:hypothetical protein